MRSKLKDNGKEILLRSMDNSSSTDDGDEDELWYVCLVCNRAFERDFQLRKHKKKVHGKQAPANRGQPKTKAGFGLILSKDDLLPKIQVQRCTRYPLRSTSTLPQDTGRLVQYEREKVSGSPIGLSRNMLPDQAQTSVMHPVIKLAKIQVKAKSSHYENRSPSSPTTQSTPNSKESAGYKQQEKPKYFSSILVNPSLSLVKTENTDPAVLCETDLTALELFTHRDRILEEPPAERTEETQFQLQQCKESEKALSDDDLEFAVDLGHMLDSPEFMEFERQAFPACELTDMDGEVGVQTAEARYDDINVYEAYESDVNCSTEEPEVDSDTTQGVEQDEQSSNIVQNMNSTKRLNKTGEVEDVDMSNKNCEPVPRPSCNSAKKSTKEMPFKPCWPKCGNAFTRKAQLGTNHKARTLKVRAFNGTSDSIAFSPKNNLELEEPETKVSATDSFDIDKKDVKLLASPACKESADEHVNVDKHVEERLVRKSTLRARAPISKSMYVESESEVEGVWTGNDTDDMESEANSSSSTEDEVCDNDFEGQEVETVDENDIMELTSASKEIFVKMGRSEEKYLQCAICYCRYKLGAVLQRHLKNIHSKNEVDKALRIFRETTKNGSVDNFSETANPKTIRTCKRCRTVFCSVRRMNRHIIQVHLEKKKVKPSVESESKELTEASKQILVEVNDDGGEEMYLECGICACRYMERKKVNLQNHIKYIHSKEEVNKALGILRQTKLTHPDSDNCVKTARVNLKDIRKCKVCHIALCSVQELNRHIVETHCKKNGKLASVQSDLDSENEEDVKIRDLTDISNKILFKVDTDEREILECVICTCRFSIFRCMRKHIRQIHSKEEIEQALLSIQKTETGKSDHIAKEWIVVTDPGEIRRCKFCGVGATTIKNMNDHIIRVHLKKCRVKCSICGREFARNKDLKTHTMRRHGSEKKCLCNTCGRAFVTERDMKLHIRRMHELHTGSVPIFNCKVCERPCASEAVLKQHVLTHSDRAHLCTICGKSFRTKTNYKNHMATHGEERPHKCNLCPAAFKGSSTLSIHQRVHNGKTYDCTQCGLKFKNREKYVLHVKKEHHGIVYKCNVCELVLSNPRSLKNHKLKYHDPNFKPGFECDICNKVFAFSHELYNHKRGHKGQAEKKFECKECGKKFGLRGHLKQHLISHIKNEGEKRFECGQCGKKFGLPHHLRQHEASHGIGDYGVKWSRNRGSKALKDPLM